MQLLTVYMTEIMDVSPICKNLLFIRINDYYAYTICDLFGSDREPSRRPSIIQLRPLGDILTFLTLIFIIFQILFLKYSHRSLPVRPEETTLTPNRLFNYAL